MRNMKKGIVFALAGVMLVSSLTGCGKGKSSSKYLLDVDYSKYVDLCDYKGVEATKVTYEITQDDIDEKVQQDLYNYATYTDITDRGVKKGDTANIDYTVTIDGKKNDDYSGSEIDIVVGEGYIYPEVDEAIIGMKAGEEKEVDATLQDGYVAEEDVGKDAKISFKVRKISEEHLPEYNDDFVKENTDYDSKKAYEAAVKKELEDSKEDEYKYVGVQDIMDYIVNNSKFDGYPDELYKKCETSFNKSNEQYASMYGMEVDEFLSSFGMDADTQKQEIENQVQYELVIGAIAQKEGIDCTEEEVDELINSTYGNFGYESTEDFLKDYSREEMGYEVLYNKVTDFLYENAKYNEIDEKTYLEQQGATTDDTSITDYDGSADAVDGESMTLDELEGAGAEADTEADGLDIGDKPSKLDVEDTGLDTETSTEEAQ